MTDEIYEHIAYRPRLRDARRGRPRLRDRTLTVNGVSKTYAMTGWRIGYAAGPTPLIRAMTTVQSQSTTNPCSISQWAAVEALNGPQDYIAEARRRLPPPPRPGRRPPERLSRASTCPEPEGAFYVYPSIAGLIGRRTPDGARHRHRRGLRRGPARRRGGGGGVRRRLRPRPELPHQLRRRPTRRWARPAAASPGSAPRSPKQVAGRRRRRPRVSSPGRPAASRPALRSPRRRGSRISPLRSHRRSQRARARPHRRDRPSAAALAGAVERLAALLERRAGSVASPVAARDRPPPAPPSARPRRRLVARRGRRIGRVNRTGGGSRPCSTRRRRRRRQLGSAATKVRAPRLLPRPPAQLRHGAAARSSPEPRLGRRGCRPARWWREQRARSRRCRGLGRRRSVARRAVGSGSFVPMEEVDRQDDHDDTDDPQPGPLAHASLHPRSFRSPGGFAAGQRHGELRRPMQQAITPPAGSGGKRRALPCPEIATDSSAASSLVAGSALLSRARPGRCSGFCPSTIRRMARP